MTGPLLFGFLWVVAAAATAMMPYRWQFPPGIVLLILAPVLIAWIGAVHGWMVGLLCLAAFLSMFRRPLIYFWKMARGLPVERPGGRR